jgi:hypothetical protein
MRNEFENAIVRTSSECFALYVSIRMIVLQIIAIVLALYVGIGSLAFALAYLVCRFNGD